MEDCGKLPNGLLDEDDVAVAECFVTFHIFDGSVEFLQVEFSDFLVADKRDVVLLGDLREAAGEGDGLRGGDGLVRREGEWAGFSDFAENIDLFGGADEHIVTGGDADVILITAKHL